LDYFKEKFKKWHFSWHKYIDFLHKLNAKKISVESGHLFATHCVLILSIQLEISLSFLAAPQA
jgi:hypothetical protein